MNANRRKEINRIISELEGLNVSTEAVKDEEQEYYENMPAAFQSSDKYVAAENAASELDTAQSSIQDAIDALNNALEG